MKIVRITLFTLLAALVAVGVSTTSYAFHSGGVAECGGCHSMHSPAGGGGNFLLVGTDKSSACLTCHEHAGDTGPSSYHISTAAVDMPAGTAPLQRTPGGDFGWLKKIYNFAIRGTATTDDGAEFGHDITAIDFGYTGRSNNPSTAPGGTFPTAQLACNSCHDPHGQYRRLTTGIVSLTGAPIKASGSYNAAANEPDATGAVGVYRLLAGSGYTKGGVTFPGVPAAKVPSSYNRTEAATQTRVAYGVATTGGHATWGNWCGTCHTGMHSNGNYVHPVDQGMSSLMATAYDSYVKTGDASGTHASSFSSLAPFASNTGVYATLAATVTTTPNQGPTSGDQVMCLSCHRAHATGFKEMLRWEQEYEFITKADSTGTTTYGGTDSTLPTDTTLGRGRTNAEKVASYYGRPASNFATYQRVLCNKCHVKD